MLMTQESIKAKYSWIFKSNYAILVIAERPHDNGGHTNRVRSGRKQH